MKHPIGWAKTTLGEIATINSGYGFPERFQGNASGDLPFAKVRDISHAVKTCSGRLAYAQHYIEYGDLKDLRAKKFPAGSTVFAKIGEALRLNRRAILEVDAIVDNNCMAVTPNLDLISSEYLYRFLHTVDLSPLAVATTVPSVRRGDIETISLSLPPQAEQHRIVAKIDSLSSKSARARDHLDRIPRLVEKYKQAVLAAAFQALDDVEWTRLGDLTARITSGSRDWSRYYGGGAAVFVLASNVRPMAFDPTPKQHVDPPLNGSDAQRTLGSGLITNS